MNRQTQEAIGGAIGVPAAGGIRDTVMRVILALSVSHLINDTLQALIPAIYPLLKASYHLSFGQIGLITFTYQLTGSLLQPVVGAFTDRRPMPWSLAAGMGCTLAGLALFSQAPNFGMILVSAALVGVGSAIFHPEASRVAHMAAGGRHGLAQSVFQVGGNLGTSFGPLLAALIIVPNGQSSLLWFTAVAFAGILLLARVGGWYGRNLRRNARRPAPRAGAGGLPLSRARVAVSLGILIALVFSKYVYLVSLTNYYTFYLIHRFGFSVRDSQYALFVFLFAIAAGTVIGGPLGDRFGRKYVIWFSILGVAPFSILLPHVGAAATIALSAVIGVVLASAFSAILVYAQEILPGRVGLVAGLFFGLAFGTSGIASAFLGRLADHTDIVFVFEVCGFMPLIGIVTAFLPDLRTARRADLQK